VFVENDSGLRDWCRFRRIRIDYIEAVSPWENAYIESFNGRVRDELLNIEEFGSLLEPRSLWKRGGSITTPTDLTAPRWVDSCRSTRRMDPRMPTSALMRAGPRKGSRQSVAGNGRRGASAVVVNECQDAHLSFEI
jgi:hypothetical protein